MAKNDISVFITNYGTLEIKTNTMNELVSDGRTVQGKIDRKAKALYIESMSGLSRVAFMLNVDIEDILPIHRN